MVIGKVILKKHALLGTGTVVLPNVTIEEGAATGAMTLVNKSLDEWKLYVGIPARFAKARDKEKILQLEAEFLEKYTLNNCTIKT